MHREASRSRASDGPRLQRAVVLELLDADGEQGRALTELAEALGADAVDLQSAVEALRSTGVLRVEAGLVSASPAARRLDELGLIAI
jgi:predicted transcriptional regulator